MDYCWNEFLKDACKNFIIESTLAKILEAFWNFYNCKNHYYQMMADFNEHRNKHDYEYWISLIR